MADLSSHGNILNVDNSYSSFFSSWLNRMLPQWHIHYETFKMFIIVSAIVVNLSLISLCMSAFLFGTIYFYHMPTIQHTFPLYFHYNRSCMQQHKVIEHGLHWDRYSGSAYDYGCFPVAKINIATPNNMKLLQEGQVYSVLAKLELPETPNNLNIGMFMVNMVVEGRPSVEMNSGGYRWSKRRDHKNPEELVIIKSSSKPMLMRYRTPLLRFTYTVLFWPLLLFGFIHESQVLDEVLFEDLMLDQESYNWTASIYIENPSIDLYSANLDIVAKFSGIQYILYRWPIISFIFGTMSFFLPTVFTNAVIFYFCIWRSFFSSNSSAGRSNASSFPPLPIPSSSDDSVSNLQNAALLRESPNRANAETQSTVSSNLSPSDLHNALPAPSGNTNSRRSSTSSSIEMIGQPSNLSLLEEVAFVSSQYTTNQALHDSVVEDVESLEVSGDLRRRHANEDAGNLSASPS